MIQQEERGTRKWYSTSGHNEGVRKGQGIFYQGARETGAELQ